MVTLEGVVRQTTKNPLEKFELEMLENGRAITGYSVHRPEDSVLIETEEGMIPVYLFKMGRELMNLLRRDSEVWNG